MLLRGGIQNLDRRLRFCFQAAGERFAVLRGDVPESIVRFDRAIWIENVRENLAAVARGDARKVGSDLSALAIESMANGTSRRENFLAAPGVASLLRQRQQLLRDFLAVG